MALRSPGNSSSGGRFWQTNPEKIEKYTSLVRIAGLIEGIDREKLSRNEKMAIAGFEEFRVLKEKGLSPDRGEYYVFEKDYDADGNLVS